MARHATRGPFGCCRQLWRSHDDCQRPYQMAEPRRSMFLREQEDLSLSLRSAAEMCHDYSLYKSTIALTLWHYSLLQFESYCYFLFQFAKISAIRNFSIDSRLWNFGCQWRSCLDELQLPWYTGWPQKSKPPPIFQKIVLKIANEIRFLRKVKVWIKHYNTIRW